MKLLKTMKHRKKPTVEVKVVYNNELIPDVYTKKELDEKYIGKTCKKLSKKIYLI